MAHKTRLQKFHRGDRVKSGNAITHSTNYRNIEGLIVGSYVDLCHQHVNSPNDTRSYKIYEVLWFVTGGQPHTVAWFDEIDLTRAAGPSGKDLLNSYLRVPFG